MVYANCSTELYTRKSSTTPESPFKKVYKIVVLTKKCFYSYEKSLVWFSYNEGLTMLTSLTYNFFYIQK